MDQTTARRLARYLSARDQWKRAIHVALTVDHLHGQYDGPDPVWVVVRWDGPAEVLTDVPADCQQFVKVGD